MSSRFQTDDEDLEIVTRQEGQALIVSARGEVTVFSSPALRECLRQVADTQPPRVIIDLAETSYIDSSGVATLVEGLRIVGRYQGKLVLAGMNPRVRGVFEIARLDSVFTVVGDVAEALKA